MGDRNQPSRSRTFTIAAALLFLGIAIALSFDRPRVKKNESAPDDPGPPLRTGGRADKANPAGEFQIMKRLPMKRLRWKGAPPKGQPKMDFILAGYESLRKLHQIMAMFEESCHASFSRYPPQGGSKAERWRCVYLRGTYSRLWGEYYQLSDELHGTMQCSMIAQLVHGIEHKNQRIKLKTQIEFHILDALMRAQLKTSEQQRIAEYELQEGQIWVRGFVREGQRVNLNDQLTEPIEQGISVALRLARERNEVPEALPGIFHSRETIAVRKVLAELARLRANPNHVGAFKKVKLFLEIMKARYSPFEDLIKKAETVRTGGDKHHPVNIRALAEILPHQQDQAVDKDRRMKWFRRVKMDELNTAIHLWEETFKSIGVFLQKSGVAKENIRKMLRQYEQENADHPEVEKIRNFVITFRRRYEDNILHEESQK